MAASKSSDLFVRLSPELRLQIYDFALTANGSLRRTRNPYKHVRDATTFAALLGCSKYIYAEAIDKFYQSNTFQLTLAEIRNYANPADFCKMGRIQLMHVRDTEEYGEGGIRTTAQNFIIEARNNTARTPKRTLALKSVVIREYYISKAYVDEMRNDTVCGSVIDSDIGAWRINLGQPYSIELQHIKLRDSWADVQNMSPEASGLSDLERMVSELRGRDTCLTRWDRDSLTKKVLCSIAQDASIGSGLRDPAWLLWHTPWLPRHMVLIVWQQLINSTGSEGPERMRDVNVRSGRKVLAWANDVLLTALDAGPAGWWE